MPLPPQKFREAVLQMLYSQDFEKGEKAEIVPFMMQELKATRRAIGEAYRRVDQILERLSVIDGLISKVSTAYSFERISRVERAVLRLGIFEILYDSQVPPLVAIAEAVRLCRKFGTPESAHFVNAILDGVFKENGAAASTESVLV